MGVLCFLGRAMIDALPQLEGGCVNYWEAGNWALNSQAEPVGEKTAPEYRKVHLHLIGRSRHARMASHRWGEAPKFPDFVDRHAWAAAHERLTPDECGAILARVVVLLCERYGMSADSMRAWRGCPGCSYPIAGVVVGDDGRCGECVAA